MPIEIKELHIKVNVKEPPTATEIGGADQDAYILAGGDNSTQHELEIARQDAVLAFEISEAEAAGIVFVGGWGSSAYQYG